jgi:hypothetical protein
MPALWLLPSYSPEMNPIEQAFSKVKKLSSGRRERSKHSSRPPQGRLERSARRTPGATSRPAATRHLRTTLYENRSNSQSFHYTNYTNAARSRPHTLTHNHEQDVLYSLCLCGFLPCDHVQRRSTRNKPSRIPLNGVSRVRIPPPPHLSTLRPAAPC